MYRSHQDCSRGGIGQQGRIRIALIALLQIRVPMADGEGKILQLRICQ